MVTVALPSGRRVPANLLDLKDIMRSVDAPKRYWPTSRELGEMMVINRMKRAVMLRRARQRARAAHQQRRQMSV